MALTPERVLRTADAGRTWVLPEVAPRTTFHGHHHPRLAVGGADPAIYVAGAGGIFRSDDSGRTWSRRDRGLPPGRADWYDLPFPVARPVTAVAVDPREPATVYAATRPAAVYRSRDGGLSWRRVGGDIGELHVTALLVDPSDGTVFAATYGGGILRLRQRD